MLERLRGDSKAQQRHKNHTKSPSGNGIKPKEHERLGDFPPWKILDSMSQYRLNKDQMIFYQDEPERQHRGARSVVNAGCFPSESGFEYELAVKMFKFEQDSDREQLASSFVHELSLLRRLNHENIVKLKGFVASYQEKIAWTVFDWYESGSLKEFLSSEEWQLSERVSLLYDVASGLEYLHGQKPPICHGNFTSLNILVNKHMDAVITGFCSARVLDSPEVDPGHLMAQASVESSAEDTLRVDFQEDTGTITLTGPLRSMQLVAPELLPSSQSSLAGDTWAFGWALAGPTPLGGTSSESTIVTYTTEGHTFAPEGTEVYGVAEGKSLPIDVQMLVPGPNQKIQRYGVPEGYGPMKLPRADKSIPEEPSRSSPLVEAIREWHEGFPKPPPVACPFSGYSYLQAGHGHLHDENFAWAEEKFILAGVSFASEPSHIGCADAIHGQGEVYVGLGMLNHAELCFATSKRIGTVLRSYRCIAQATLGLWAVFRRQGKLSQAEELLAEAMQNYTKIGHDDDRIDILCKLGGIDLEQDLGFEAEECFSEAMQIGESGGDNQCADVLHKFGDLYLEHRQYSKAEELYTWALSVCILLKRNAGRRRIMSHLRLGDLYKDWGRYTEAEAHYTQVLTLDEDDWGIPRSMKRLHELYLKQGRYTEAEEHCTQTLELWASDLELKEDSDRCRAGTLQKLGDLCRMQARYSEAGKHLTEAINIFTSGEDGFGRAGVLRKLGDLYLVQSRYSFAADHLTEALSIYTSLRDGHNRAETLRQLGDLYQRQGRHSKAEENFTEAQTAYASRGDRFRHAEVLCQLANLYQVQDRHLEARKHFDEAITILASMGARAESNRADVLCKIGQLHQHQGQYIEAEELFTEALEISTRIGDMSSRAKTLRRLGDLYRRQARYSGAEESLTTALQIYASLGDHLGHRRVQSSMADVSRLQCRFAAAEAAFREVGAFYGQICYPLGDAYAKCRLGDTYRQQGKHSKALELYREAQNIFEKLNHTPGLADVVLGHGHVLRLKGRYSRAHSCFFEAGSLYTSIGNKIGLAEVTCGIGDLCRLRGKYSEAEESYTKARSTYQRAGSENHPLGLAGAICGLGYIHCSQGRHSEAHTCFKEAKSLYDGVGNKLGVAETFCGMGDLHRSQGEYLKAEESYTEAQTIYHQLNHSLGVGEVTCGLGYLRRMQCRFDEAELLFSEARKLCSEEEHGLGAANAALGLATVHLSRMECDAAASDVRKALDFYTQADVLPSKARALLILAQIRGLEHHDNELRAYIDEASAIFFEIGDENGVSLCREHRLHLAHPNVETSALTSTEGKSM